MQKYFSDSRDIVLAFGFVNHSNMIVFPPSKSCHTTMTFDLSATRLIGYCCLLNHVTQQLPLTCLPPDWLDIAAFWIMSHNNDLWPVCLQTDWILPPSDSCHTTMPFDLSASKQSYTWIYALYCIIEYGEMYILIQISVSNGKIKLSSGTFWRECEIGWSHHTSRSESQQHRREGEMGSSQPKSPQQAKAFRRDLDVVTISLYTHRCSLHFSYEYICL